MKAKRVTRVILTMTEQQAHILRDTLTIEMNKGPRGKVMADLRDSLNKILEDK